MRLQQSQQKKIKKINEANKVTNYFHPSPSPPGYSEKYERKKNLLETNRV